APLPASKVNALAASDTSMNVTWTDTSDTETGFRIERNSSAEEAAAAWVVAGTVGAGETSFTDTGLTSGVTYSYRVIAFNDAGDSMTTESLALDARRYRATTRVAHAAGAPIQVEAYQTQNGGVWNTLTETHYNDDGDWVSFSDVDLSGATTMFIRLASPHSNN